MKACYTFVALFLIFGTLLHLLPESAGDGELCLTTQHCVEGDMESVGHGPVPGTCCQVDEGGPEGMCLPVEEAKKCEPK